MRSQGLSTYARLAGCRRVRLSPSLPCRQHSALNPKDLAQQLAGDVKSVREHLHRPQVAQRPVNKSLYLLYASDIVLSLVKLYAASAAGPALAGAAVSSLATASVGVTRLAARKYSALPPDPLHPYGHAKVDVLARTLVSVFALLAAIKTGRQCVKLILGAYHASSAASAATATTLAAAAASSGTTAAAASSAGVATVAAGSGGVAAAGTAAGATGAVGIFGSVVLLGAAAAAANAVISAGVAAHLLRRAATTPGRTVGLERAAARRALVDAACNAAVAGALVLPLAGLGGAMGGIVSGVVGAAVCGSVVVAAGRTAMHAVRDLADKGLPVSDPTVVKALSVARSVEGVIAARMCAARSCGVEAEMVVGVKLGVGVETAAEAVAVLEEVRARIAALDGVGGVVVQPDEGAEVTWVPDGVGGSVGGAGDPRSEGVQPRGR